MAILRGNQAILDMVNATIDQIFVAIMRGSATCASCRKDMDFLVDLRERFYHDEVRKLDFVRLSDQITRIFAKYSSQRAVKKAV